MPKRDDTPKALKPYRWHGIEYEIRDEQAVADCPFCGREGKFSINVNTGLWRCWVCAEGSPKGGGNIERFFQMLLDKSPADEAKLIKLAEERKLLNWETLKRWGIRISFLTDEIIIPGYSAEGKIANVYRYMRQPDGKYRFLPTPGYGHGIHGAFPLTPCETVYNCEGPWDGMALWETLRFTKETDSGLALTANESSSLLLKSRVVAMPGANVFNEKWSSIYEGKGVILLGDSDHPKLHCKPCSKSWSIVEHKVCAQCNGELTGPEAPPAGYVGMKRVAGLLGRAAAQPVSIQYIGWGKDGYDPDKPNGFDVRDFLSLGDSPGERVKYLGSLLGAVTTIPNDWILGRSKHTAARGATEIECVPCYDWKTLIKYWRLAMKWTDGLEHGLACVLATVTSTKSVGCQLWIKLISPPSTGKTTLVEAVGVNHKYTLSKDTITGLVSGYQKDKDGTENNSLAPKLKDKTLLIKDGDTLLSMPDVSKILSQFRAFYDRSIRSQYGNEMSADHEAINATVVLCGTSRLRSLDSSEVGERFLDVRIMDKIDDELEDEILWKVANRADQSLGIECDGTMETQHTPEEVKVMQMTGGYVGFLRENAQALLGAVANPPESLQYCARLGKYVAYMRARPSTKQDEVTEREMGARLVEQMVRLAKCLAVVLNRKSVDNVVLAHVRKVAMDTASGKTSKIAKFLFERGSEGAFLSQVAFDINMPDDKTKNLLIFLREIGVVEMVKVVGRTGVVAKAPSYRLASRFWSLYKEVMRVEQNSVQI